MALRREPRRFAGRKTPLLAAPLLLLLSGSADEIALAPAQDLVVSKTFEHTTSLELDEFVLLRDGEEPEEPMEMEHTTEQRFSLSVTDRYAAIDEDGPTRVERTYDEVAGSSEDEVSNEFAGDEAFETVLVSDVEGLGVVFVRGEDGWEAELAEESAGEDEGLLIELAQDLDLTALLPPGEVDEEDSWDVELGAFLDVLDPGGFLKLYPEDTEVDADWADIAERFEERERELEGEVTATYGGTREVDGELFAVITLDVDVTTNEDETEQVRAQMEENPPEEGAMVPDFEEMSESYSYEGDGELLWDLARGIPLSLELELDAERTQRQVLSFDFMDQEHEIDQTMVFSGTVTTSVTYEVL
jgi:hypothetical protein